MKDRELGRHEGEREREMSVCVCVCWSELMFVNE